MGRPSFQAQTGPQTGTSSPSDAPFQAQITKFDVVGENAGATSRSTNGALFPGLSALVSTAGSLIGQGGQHAVYTVRVTCNGQVTTVQKRFSDFDQLHTRLLVAFPA